MVVLGMKKLLSVLKAYAHENGCLWDQDNTTYATLNGHLDYFR